MSIRKVYPLRLWLQPYGMKPQISWPITGQAVKLWAELTTLEKERWRRLAFTSGYAGFVLSYFIMWSVASIFTMYYLRHIGDITQSEFESLVPSGSQNWVITFNGG